MSVPSAVAQLHGDVFEETEDNLRKVLQGLSFGVEGTGLPMDPQFVNVWWAAKNQPMDTQW